MEIRRLGHAVLGAPPGSAPPWTGGLDTLGLIGQQTSVPGRAARPRPGDGVHPPRPGQRPGRPSHLGHALLQPHNRPPALGLPGSPTWTRSPPAGNTCASRPMRGLGQDIQAAQIFDYWRDPDKLMFEHYTDGDVFDLPTYGTRWALLSVSGLSQWGRGRRSSPGPNAPRVVVAAIKAPGEVGNERTRALRGLDQGDEPGASAWIARTGGRLVAVVTLPGWSGWTWPPRRPPGCSPTGRTRQRGRRGRQARRRDAVPAKSLTCSSSASPPARGWLSGGTTGRTRPTSDFDLGRWSRRHSSVQGLDHHRPGRDIIRPEGGGFLDYEVELGLVIGADRAEGRHHGDRRGPSPACGCAGGRR